MLRRSPKQARNWPLRALRATAALVLAVAAVAGCRQSAQDRTQANTLVGVGGSFPAPLYTRWAEGYRGKTGVAVNYQGVGSGPAMAQLPEDRADFVGSDEPLTADQLRSGLYQFPTVVGGLTPVVNLPGIGPGQLRLTGALLGDIYLGAVTRWDDPQVVALNPTLKLPAEPISVVHRQLPSGTTLLFTTYLSAVSPAWKARVGAGQAVAWPVGAPVRGTGGIVAFVQQTSGAIGYVGYAYARQNNLAYVQLQNHDGAFLTPSAAAFAAATAGADLARAPGAGLQLLDRPGAGAWPITGATFIVLRRQPPDPEKTREVLAFFDWAYRNGDAAAASLGFVPLPAPAKDQIRKQWATMIRGAGGQAVYPPKP